MTIARISKPNGDAGGRPKGETGAQLTANDGTQDQQQGPQPDVLKADVGEVGTDGREGAEDQAELGGPGGQLDGKPQEPHHAGHEDAAATNAQHSAQEPDTEGQPDAGAPADVVDEGCPSDVGDGAAAAAGSLRTGQPRLSSAKGTGTAPGL